MAIGTDRPYRSEERENEGDRAIEAGLGVVALPLRPDHRRRLRCRSMNATARGSVDLIFADPPYNLQLGGDLTRRQVTRRCRER